MKTTHRAFVLTAAILSLQLPAVRGDVTFFDDTFNDADWTMTTASHGNGGTTTATQRFSGGNPGSTSAAKALLAEYQAGETDRTRLSEEFNFLLTDEKLAGAAGRLKPFGTPTKAELVSRGERGGMEVSVTRLSFERGQLRTLMYRQPDGRVEQFFVYED